MIHAKMCMIHIAVVTRSIRVWASHDAAVSSDTEEPVTYTVIDVASQRGKPKLTDSSEYIISKGQRGSNKDGVCNILEVRTILWQLLHFIYGL